MKKKEFGPLYAKASNGKTKTWACLVIEDDGVVTLNVIHGYLNGKQTTDTREVKGKNIGKANETSPWDQGLSEAQSKQNKKIDEGYMETLGDVEGTKIALPMLALKYSERKHDIVWPCFIQPKLNGVRCTVKEEKKKVEYISRKGKAYTTLDHLNHNMNKALLYLDECDGEVFNATFTFQEITSAVKKTKELTKELEYWMYDIVNTDLDFEDRNKLIKDFFDEFSLGTNSFGFRTFGGIIEVPTIEVKNEAEFLEWHAKWTAMGFEGTMLRNKKGKYVQKHRSKDLQKYKDFLDAEFKIIGGFEATGNDAGTVVFQCVTGDDKPFSVRPKGSREIRREWLKDIDKLIGKELTVRYQNFSDDGIPIFPVGICLRDYE